MNAANGRIDLPIAYLGERKDQKISAASSAVLLTWLANATKTYYNAGGHSKAHYNDIKRKAIAIELKQRSEPVPSDDELLKTGEINGEGSY